MCLSFSFLFIYFTRFKKKGPFTRVTTYNRLSFLFIYFTRFGEKRTVYKGDHVQPSVCLFFFFSFISHVLRKINTRHPSIDRLLLTRSLSLFLFIFLFFHLFHTFWGKKKPLQGCPRTMLGHPPPPPPSTAFP
jgi:hypothetical protein